MRRVLRALALGLVTGAVGLMLALTPFGAKLEENAGLAWLFRLRGPVPPPAEVVLVTMDRRSAEVLELPLQPRAWPRALHARLIDRLVDAGASAIVLDLILDAPSADAADDAALALAMRRAERVVTVAFLDRRSTPIRDADGQPIGLMSIEERLVPPLPIFAAAARGVAAFPLPRTPAQVSQFWAFKEGAGGLPTLPVLALQLHAAPAADAWRALLAQADAPAASALPPADGDVVELARRQRLLFREDRALGDRAADALAAEAAALAPEQRRLLAALARLYTGDDSRHLNFYGPPGHLANLSYERVLADPDLDLHGKVAFVGVAQLHEAGPREGFDTVYTQADGARLSGLEIMATAFANLLAADGLQPTPVVAEGALLVGLGLALAAGAMLVPAAAAVPVVLVLGAAWLGLALLAFAQAALWLPVALPLLVQLPLALLGGLLGQYLQAQRARRRASQAIRYYVPEAVAQGIADGAAGPAPDRLVYGVCLATDAERFTALSETLPPTELKALLNAYFEALVEPVRRHGGTVSDIVADGMMCLWTAPAPDPALRATACRAALDLHASALRFNREHAPHELPTRIGLHAGWVTLGHVGGGGRFAYSVVGDIANTASRLESLNKALGTRLVASSDVIEGLESLLLRPLGRFRLRGKAGLLAVAEIRGPLAAASAAERRLVERFAGALELVDALRLEEAARAFEAILAEHPEDGPARFYLERCRDRLPAAGLRDELVALGRGAG